MKPRDSISMGVSNNAKMTLFVPSWLTKQSVLTLWRLDLEVTKHFSLFPSVTIYIKEKEDSGSLTMSLGQQELIVTNFGQSFL